MRFALGRLAGQPLGTQPPCGLENAADVQQTVVQVVDYLRIFAQQEQTVHVDGVACEQGVAALGVALQELQQVALDVGRPVGAAEHARGEPRLAVGAGTPLVHGVEQRLGLVDYAVEGVADAVELGVGDDGADLDDAVLGVVEPGHLAVNPH